MLRATIKSLLSRKVRLVLSGLAVVLGVMFVAGAFVLTDTLGRSFDNLFTNIYASTDVQVTKKTALDFDGNAGVDGPTANIPAAEVDRVAALAGVSSATGMVVADNARVVGSNGKTIPSQGPPRLGESWHGETDGLRLFSGRAPTADNEIVINDALATQAGLHVGDRVRVLTPQANPTSYTLVGTAGYGTQGTRGGVQEIWFTQPVAQRVMLGAPDVFSHIDVKTAAGYTDDQVRATVAGTLGDGYTVKTGQQLTDETVDEFTTGLASFNKVLLGFACVALFVGAFLILNTFSILIAQRTKELALMRALGAAGGQVIGAVLLEAVVVGLIASVLGLGAGIGVGAGLAYLFGHMNGGALELAGIGVPTSAVVASFVVGILLTVVAATLPALRAARIAPIAAMRESATNDRPLTRVTIAGATVTAIGAAALGWGFSGAGGATLWLILGGILLSFVGIALLTPYLGRPIVGLIGRLFSWSVPGKLGRLNSARNPRRTAITAAALMVGVALITGANTVVSSLKASFASFGKERVHAQLIISGDNTGGPVATFDPAISEQIRAMPEVQYVASQLGSAGQIQGHKPESFAAVDDMVALTHVFDLQAVTGQLRALGPGEAVVDDKQAAQDHVSVGSTVPITFISGQTVPYQVVGIYKSSDMFGGWILSGADRVKFGNDQAQAAFVAVKPGASVTAVQHRIDALLADNPEVTVADQAGFIKAQLAPLNQVVTMISIMLWLAIIIASLGVINTLALSVLERTRELGLLRAIGLRSAQVLRMVTVESVVISLFGAVLGLAVGAGLGAAAVRALKDEGFSDLAFPWNQMTVYLILAAVIGMVAAIIPAIRAARINVLAAISHE
jgi:putative ABC transport system permease protein